MTLVSSFNFVSQYFGHYFFQRLVDKHHNIYIGDGHIFWRISAVDGSIDKSLVPILKNLKGSVRHIEYVARWHSFVVVTVHSAYYIFLLNLDTLQVKQIGDPLCVGAWHFSVEQDTLQLLITHSAWGIDRDGVMSINLETGLQTPLSTTFERFLLFDWEWISLFPADARGIHFQSEYIFCNKKSGDRWTVQFPFSAAFHSMYYHKLSKTLLASDNRTQFVTYHLPTRTISGIAKLDHQKSDDSRVSEFFVDSQRSDVFVVYSKSSKNDFLKNETEVDIYRHRNILPHPLSHIHQVARWCRLLSLNEKQKQQQRRYQLLYAIISNAMGTDNKLSAPQIMSLYSHYSSRDTLQERYTCPFDRLS